MASYRYNSFKFPAAALAGVDADAVKGLRSYLASRESVLNTITTSSHVYGDGPFVGQTIELESGRTLPISVKGWIGHYDCGKWHGTTGEPLTVVAPVGELAKHKDTPAMGKGFNALGDLFGQLSEPVEDHTEPTTITVTSDACIGRVDDFGDFMAGRDGRQALQQDDYGLQIVADHRAIEWYSRKKPVIRAVYKIGRTVFKVNQTDNAIDALRARLIKGKKWFADKYVRPIDPEMMRAGCSTGEINAKAAEAVAQVVASAIAAAAISEAMAQTEDDAELVTCEAGENEAATVTHGASWAPMPQYQPPVPSSTGFGDVPKPAFRGTFDDTPTAPVAVSGAVSGAPAAESTEAPAVNVPEAPEVQANDAPASEALDLTSEWHAATLASATNRVNAKSGLWQAHLFMIESGLYAMAFVCKGKIAFSTYATPRERMASLKALALAADAPNDTPPDDQKTPENAGSDAAAGTAPAVSSEEPTPAPAVSSGFERVKPFNLNPLKLLEAGATTAQLIGLGVRYTGDMANPSGVGAITSVEDTRGDRFGHLRMMCLLEDGRTVNAEPHYFTATLRPILQFDGKMHGAPYLSELAMAAALAKSKRSSADELAKLAHDKALIDLAAKHPQLKQGDKHAGGKLAAVNARILLKQAFRGIKFSVRSDYNSMRIEWQDGPTDAQVNDVVGMFDIGASDTQSDYFYTVSTAFSDLFGGVQYLTTTRNTSDALIQEAIDQAFKSNDEKPTLSDWKTGANEMGWGDWKRRWVNEALKTISRM